MPEDTRADRLNLEIRAHLARHRMAQKDLAALLEVSQASASARLNGQVRWTLGELWKLTDRFGIQLADLVASVENERQQVSA